MKPNFSSFSAAIFDLDGTLADSNTVWEKLDRLILGKYEVAVDDDFITKLAAMTYSEAAEAMRKKDIPISEKDFTAEINALAKNEYADVIMLKPYAAELLRYVKSIGMKIILATASPEELFEPLLRRFDVYKLFDGFVTTDEIGKSKEYTDIYIKAAEIAGVPISKCVIFEDTITAVKTASQTGAFVCAVYDKYSEQNADEIKNTADRYVYSFNELL